MNTFPDREQDSNAGVMDFYEAMDHSGEGIRTNVEGQDEKEKEEEEERNGGSTLAIVSRDRVTFYSASFYRTVF